jgi:hypothetical protein
MAVVAALASEDARGVRFAEAGVPRLTDLRGLPGLGGKVRNIGKLDAVDELQNPFRPGAGTAPPALVGRDALIESFRITVGRALAGRPGQSVMPIGLRGVGKTVLLNRFAEVAEGAGLHVGYMEAPENGDFATLLAGQAAQAPAAPGVAGQDDPRGGVRAGGAPVVRLHAARRQLDLVGVDPVRGRRTRATSPMTSPISSSPPVEQPRSTAPASSSPSTRSST